MAQVNLFVLNFVELAGLRSSFLNWFSRDLLYDNFLLLRLFPDHIFFQVKWDCCRGRPLWALARGLHTLISSLLWWLDFEHRLTLFVIGEQLRMVRFIIHIDHIVDLNPSIDHIILFLLSLKVVTLALLLFVGIERAHAPRIWSQGSGLAHLEGTRSVVSRDLVIPCLLLQAFIIFVILLLNRVHLRVDGSSGGAAVELVISEMARLDATVSQG